MNWFAKLRNLLLNNGSSILTKPSVYDTHYKWCKWLAITIGHWPGENKYFCYFLYVYQITVSSVALYGQIDYLYKVRQDSDEVCSASIWVVVHVYIFLQIFNYMSSKKSLSKEKEMVQEDYIRWSDPISRQIFSDYALLVEKLTYFAIAITPVPLLCVMLLPFVLALQVHLKTGFAGHEMKEFLFFGKTSYSFALNYVLIVLVIWSYGFSYFHGFNSLCFLSLTHFFIKSDIIEYRLNSLGRGNGDLDKVIEFCVNEHNNLAK